MGVFFISNLEDFPCTESLIDWIRIRVKMIRIRHTGGIPIKPFGKKDVCEPKLPDVVGRRRGNEKE